MEEVKTNKNDFKKLLLPVVYDYLNKQSKVFELTDKNKLKQLKK